MLTGCHSSVGMAQVEVDRLDSRCCMHVSSNSCSKNRGFTWPGHAHLVKEDVLKLRDHLLHVGDDLDVRLLHLCGGHNADGRVEHVGK